LVLLIIRKRPLRLVRNALALCAVEAVPKCAPGDVPRPGGFPQGHPIPARYKGVMNFKFKIWLHDD
jgi:hypothetical protein